MATDRDLSQEIRRWLRVGAFTLTALGPVINTLRERLQARSEGRSRQQEIEQQTNEQPNPQERLVALGAALAESMAELRAHPYSRKLARQGGLLAEELMDRGRKLSRTVSESGSDASQQLVKRGQKTRKKWSQSKARLKKELRKRNRKAQQAQALRSNMFWLAFVCSAGLTAAAIAIYLYIQRRKQQQEAYDQPIELLQNDRRNGDPLKEQVSSTRSPASSEESSRPYAESGLASREPAIADGLSASGVGELSSRPVEQAIPEDATVIGVVSTRLYYPIEVPLEQLTAAEDDAEAGGVTVIYFASEDEAQSRGFTAAGAQ
ncbi:MAG TPA: hypothetical protein VFB60_16125 [Ktedonobacteraceae bacterium]|nr:hypothetical protein [Ktedonobacteraceae bacterium]